MLVFGQLTTILLYVQYSTAKLMIPDDTNVTQENMIKCAIKIANSNFSFRKETVIWFKDVEISLVNKFVMSYNGTVMVESKEEELIRQVVVIVESFQSFIKIVGKLKPDLRGKSALNGGAKFLIILFSNRKIERINSILWNYYVTEVVVVAKGHGNSILLYTYFPFKNHLNCRNTEPSLIGTWNEKFKLKNLYPDKMRNMNECPLYISTNKIKYPLTEKKIPLEIIKKSIVKLLRDIMNFTPIVSVKNYISIDSVTARNWSDSLSDVIAGVANISTSTIPLEIDKFGHLDCSATYFRVRLLWLTSPISPGPGWWRLFSPLNGYLWLILLIIIFFVKSLPFAMKIPPIKRFCSQYLRNATKLRGTVFRIWGVMVGQPVYLAPKRFRDFYIIGLWIWFTFVVRSAYQSVLIGALKTETIEGNYANLIEAIRDGYKIGGRSGIYSHFEYDPMIKEHFEEIPEADFDNLFHDVLEGKKKYVLAMSLEYAFAFCNSQGKKDDECGHVLPDSIMSVPLVIWLKKYSPYLRPLSVWLPRLIESGLLQKDSDLKSAHCCQISTDQTPLTDHQIISCMLCLFLGYIVSFVVFIVEVFRFKTMEYTIEKKTPFRN